jgi:hypothetical protein
MNRMISISYDRCAAFGATPPSRNVPPEKREISGPVEKPYPARGHEVKHKKISLSFAWGRRQTRDNNAGAVNYFTENL